jgi:cytosine/adenosine deaminase-related metal-dependent hydrolase
MPDLTILGGFLVPSAHEVPRPEWGLLIAGGMVTALGPNEVLRGQAGAGRVVDARDHILLPGFVNAHTHLYGILSHGMPVPVQPTGFYSFLEDFWWPYVEDQLDHDLIEASAALACVEMLHSGITTFCDILEAPHAIPGGLDAAARAVERAGLRGVLCFEATERAGKANGELGLRENTRFANARQATGGLVSGMMCIHTTFTCSPEFIRRGKAMAREAGLRLHFHLSEGTYEPEYCARTYGCAPVEHYERLGFWDDSVVAAQVVQVTDAEIEILGRRRVHCAHLPLSNCEVGGGIAPVTKLLGKGLNVGLGTDGYINDFFQVMRGAFLIHKAALLSPQVMPARTVLRMGTELGARALGFPELGRLAVGAPADVIAVRNDFSTPVTAENLLDQLVLFGHPRQVETVVVGGRVVVDGGAITTLDEAAVRARGMEAARRLWDMIRKAAGGQTAGRGTPR